MQGRPPVLLGIQRLGQRRPSAQARASHRRQAAQSARHAYQKADEQDMANGGHNARSDDKAARADSVDALPVQPDRSCGVARTSLSVAGGTLAAAIVIRLRWHCAVPGPRFRIRVYT